MRTKWTWLSFEQAALIQASQLQAKGALLNRFLKPHKRIPINFTLARPSKSSTEGATLGTEIIRLGSQSQKP